MSAQPLMTAGARAPLWLLVLITVSGTLGMHMFVPALPDAAHGLGATTAAMQATISVYILGLAGGQLIYGPLSDSLGRRPMLLVGLALYTVAGAAAAFAPSVHALVGARLLQALGGCAGLALGRAIVRDTSRPEDAVRELALLNLMMMVGPGFAPLLGSGLVATFGWRSVFVVLTAMGAVTLFFTVKLLPETAKPTGTIRLSTLARDYAVLVRSPSFVGFAIGGGCATTSIYAFIAAAPFIVVSQLHRPLHEVGFYLALLIVGMSCGNTLTRRLVRSVSIGRLLLAGNAISLASAAVLLAITLGGYLTLAAALITMFLFALGAGAASPAALSKALGVNSTVVGSAAGLYGCAQMVVGAICTSMVGFGSNPALAAAIVLTVASAVAQVSLTLALQRERATA